MQINREYFYFYFGWNGVILAFYGELFGRYIDISWTWQLYAEKIDEEE